jgi:hypothetical protein
MCRWPPRKRVKYSHAGNFVILRPFGSIGSADHTRSKNNGIFSLLLRHQLLQWPQLASRPRQSFWAGLARVLPMWKPASRRCGSLASRTGKCPGSEVTNAGPVPTRSWCRAGSIRKADRSIRADRCCQRKDAGLILQGTGVQIDSPASSAEEQSEGLRKPGALASFLRIPTKIPSTRTDLCESGSFWSTP